MSRPNILFARIDNRLVHGQVAVTWTSTIGQFIDRESRPVSENFPDLSHAGHRPEAD